MPARQTLCEHYMCFFETPTLLKGNYYKFLKASCKESQKTLVWVKKKWFGPTFLYSLLRLVKGTAKPNTSQREQCNECGNECGGDVS
jgi:hypothetical protein